MYKKVIYNIILNRRRAKKRDREKKRERALEINSAIIKN